MVGTAGRKRGDGDLIRNRYLSRSFFSPSSILSVVTVPGSYNSVYADEDEEAAMAPDAQHVQVPSNPAATGRQGGSNGSAAQTNTPSKPGKGGYSSID